jgi:hypothetical protein
MQEGAVGQAGEGAQRGAGNGLGSGAGETAAKDADGGEERLFGWLELLPGGVKDGAHAAMALGEVTQVGVQQPQALGNAGRDLG